MTDPIKQALQEVEVTDEPADPGMGQVEMGEEIDAMPEGPLADDDADALEGSDDAGGFSLRAWAERTPEGSHTDFDARDWWDPETGGENRIAFHLADAADAGAGYPNVLGVVVGAAELYWSKVQQQNGDDSSNDGSDEQDAPDADAVSREEAEALV